MESTATQLKISCHGCGQKLDVSDLEPFIKILCPVCQTELIIPRPFGNLLLEENIGRGDIATVYRAIDLTLDREIAVKVLRPRYARSEELQTLFISEARIASAINHPNIIPIYSCGELEGQPFIVMQFMEGGSLAQLGADQDETLPVEKVCRWFHEVAKGLESAYIHGVLHHDLAPSNVFLDVDENVKIGDFGLAQILFEECGHERGAEALAGLSMRRACYVSPERISTGREDVQGDIFSFGASFYHVLTQREPFNGATTVEILEQRFNALPPPPHELCDVPRTISEMIMKSLSVYPSERPRSYADLACIIDAEFAKPAPEDSQKLPVRPAAPRPGSGRSSGRSSSRTREKGRRISKPKRKKKVITIAPAASVIPAETAPASPAVAWAPRIILAAIIFFLVLLLIVHVKNPPWYEHTIRPLFQPAPPQAH